MSNPAERITSRLITDKKNQQYTVKVDAATFKPGKRVNQPKWSIDYEVINSAGERIGHGSFTIIWTNKNEAMPADDTVFDALLGNGSDHVSQDIDRGEDIASKGYNMFVGH